MKIVLLLLSICLALNVLAEEPKASPSPVPKVKHHKKHVKSHKAKARAKVAG